MISPLDVEIVIIAKRVHDDMRSRTTVVDIPHDMQGVNRQPLDKVTHGDDEIVRTLGRDNGADNYIDVSMFIRLHTRLMQQFLNDV